MAKIASLQNFPTVSDKGIYMAESFASKFIQGQRVLSPTFSFATTIDNTDTGFTNLATLLGMTSVALWSSSITTPQIIGIADDSRIYHYAPFGGTSRGELHRNTDLGSAGDVFTTDNDNIIYSGKTRLGKGLRGVVKTGSSTSTIVDTEGRNLTTLGITAVSGHNIVYNINTGESHTITSITTTDATNDTMNFTAAAANTAADIFIAFNDEGYGTDFDFFTSTAYPQYISQKSQDSIIHQIRQFNTGEYLILNGNWLAQLDSDESTWNDNAKQFPANTEGTCFAINQNQMLIGASYKGRGRLLLWNGFSDGFLSTVELERAPQAVEAYNNGWILFVGAQLYFTNGYSSTLIDTLPDSDFFSGGANVNYNGMKIVGDIIYLNAKQAHVNRSKSGTWMYDMKAGWTYLPSLTSSGPFLNGQTMGALINLSSGSTGVNAVFSSYGALNPAPNLDVSFIGRITDELGYRPSATFFLDLGMQRKVSRVTVSLGIKDIASNTSGTDTTATVSVAVGDGRKKLTRWFTSGSSNTTTTLKNTSAATSGAEGIVGQQVRLQKGAATGERSYVQSIAAPGTASEVLTIAPALSTAPSDSQSIIMSNLRATKTPIVITNMQLPEFGICHFDCDGILSDKIFIEVYITGSDADVIEIHGVDIE